MNTSMSQPKVNGHRRRVNLPAAVCRNWFHANDVNPLLTLVTLLPLPHQLVLIFLDKHVTNQYDEYDTTCDQYYTYNIKFILPFFILKILI